MDYRIISSHAVQTFFGNKAPDMLKSPCPAISRTNAMLDMIALTTVPIIRISCLKNLAA